VATAVASAAAVWNGPWLLLAGATGDAALCWHAHLLLAYTKCYLFAAGPPTSRGKVLHAFTAHPKRDPETGELFYFGYSVRQAPHCEQPSRQGCFGPEGLPSPAVAS
jgi:hypothetical protein